MTEQVVDRRRDARLYRLQVDVLAGNRACWIESAAGDRAFHVRTVSDERGTVAVDDAAGRERYRIPGRLSRDGTEIAGPEGLTATVRAAHLAPLRERIGVDLRSGEEWTLEGDVLGHEYEIEGPDGQVARASLRWFRAADTFGVEVAPSADDALVLTVAITVDRLLRPRS
jgi:uncharacterized protein YxjI